MEDDSISSFIGDLTTRMADVEERFRLLRERVFTVSQTLLKQGERLSKAIMMTKEEVRKLKEEMDRLKGTAEHIVKESSEFARREEVESLNRMVKMFSPLKPITEEDVRRIVSRIIKEKK